MKETTFKLISSAITLAHEKGLIAHGRIETMTAKDRKMVCKVCGIPDGSKASKALPLLVFFSCKGIPIHGDNLEKNREHMTPALAKFLATILNGYVELFIASDDAYTQSFNFINYEESPDDILKAFEEIVENLRTYH